MYNQVKKNSFNQNYEFYFWSPYSTIQIGRVIRKKVDILLSCNNFCLKTGVTGEIDHCPVAKGQLNSE